MKEMMKSLALVAMYQLEYTTHQVSALMVADFTALEVRRWNGL
jgi:hypothetical protein